MKSLFIIKIQSQSDVITNSSSELFIFDDKNSKEEVIELLNNVYIKESKVLFKDFIETSECNELLKEFNENLKTEKYKLPEAKLAKDCGLEPEIFWSNFNDLKVEIKGEEWKHIHCPYSKISEEGKEALIKANSNAWLLYSLDENPNWDHQEDLMEIATRIHLG